MTKLPEVSYVSNKLLAKIFKCSESHIRKQYTSRFEKIALKEKPLLQQMKHARTVQDRERFGYRFLKPHMIEWLTSSSTLTQQTAMSLTDRCTQFKRQFPEANMNATLLR